MKEILPKIFLNAPLRARWQAKKIPKAACLLLVMMLLSSLLQAQVRKVTGKITDAADGTPLAGVTVSVKGRAGSTVTDVQGVYTISADIATESLVFSSVGFARQTLPLAGKSTLDVVMRSEAKDMTDVVVVGYTTKKKTEITGAVATIKAAEIQDVPAPNIAAALRGRIAGLGVNQNSGRPGSSITLNVRNAGTSEAAAGFGVTSEPLYVVDNIIVPRITFDNLDPALVEDITILKDASAAIYGAAGAKGVILITTKRGKVGKPTLSYNGYAGVSDAASKPDMLSAYDHAVLLGDSYRVYNGAANIFFSQADLETLRNNNIKDWYDELWKPSLMQRHNISISGGSERVTFFTGGNYQNENGNYAGIRADKFGFRSGVNTTITNDLKAEINFNVDYNKRLSNNPNSENDQTFYQQLITTPKWVPIQINGLPVNFSNLTANNNTNPLAAMNSGYYDRSSTSSYRINASMTYQPSWLKGLTARFQVSQSSTSTRAQVYRPSYLIYNFVRGGNNQLLYTDQLLPGTAGVTTAVGQGNTRLNPSLAASSSYQGFLTLNYQRTFGDHTVSLMVGGDQSGGDNENINVYWNSQQLAGIDDFWAFDQTTFTRQDRAVGETRKRSFLSRFGYNYKGKYVLDGIARLDASSNFATGKTWGLFPTVGFAWNVSEEKFFKEKVNFINYLKVRVNYGLVGDDRVTSRLWQDRFSVDLNGYNYNEALLAGLNPNVIANPNISWEKARTFNAGIEATIFNGKLTLGIDVFSRHNYDVFDKGNDDNFPMYAGFKAPVVNYQKGYSWGQEFSISYRDQIAKTIGFNSSINFSFGNSVTTQQFYNRFKLFEVESPEYLTFGLDSRSPYNGDNIGLISKGMLRTQADVDALLKQYPNYTINGKVPQPGWLYFEDTNKDGKITDRDMVPMSKNPYPFLSTGISLGFSYKSLSLNTNISARFGGREYYDRFARKAATPTINVPSFWKDHWTPETPDAKYPRFDDASMVANWDSDFWGVNGTLIRINNMSLNWRLPKPLLAKLGLSNAALLVTGNNLWTIVNPLKFKDPYSSYIYDYPILRTISVGVNVSL